MLNREQVQLHCVFVSCNYQSMECLHLIHFEAVFLALHFQYILWLFDFLTAINPVFLCPMAELENGLSKLW